MGDIQYPHQAENGSVARDLPDGGKEFKAPDGTLTITGKNGETRKMILPNGTINEILPDESQRQTNPDGTVITALRTGTVVQVKGSVKITRMPVGITIEEDTKLGYKATKFPDGYEMIETPDGMTIDRAPDGTTKVSHGDGLEVETFEDGSKKVKLPNGRYRFVPPPPKPVKEWDKKN